MHANHAAAIAIIRSAIDKCQKDGIPIRRGAFGLRRSDEGTFVLDTEAVVPGVCALGAVALGREGRSAIAIAEQVLGVDYMWVRDFVRGFDDESGTGVVSEAMQAGSRLAKEVFGA